MRLLTSKSQSDVYVSEQKINFPKSSEIGHWLRTKAVKNAKTFADLSRHNLIKCANSDSRFRMGPKKIVKTPSHVCPNERNIEGVRFLIN